MNVVCFTTLKWVLLLDSGGPQGRHRGLGAKGGRSHLVQRGWPLASATQVSGTPMASGDFVPTSVFLQKLPRRTGAFTLWVVAVLAGRLAGRGVRR